MVEMKDNKDAETSRKETMCKRSTHTQKRFNGNKIKTVKWPKYFDKVNKDKDNDSNEYIFNNIGLHMIWCKSTYSSF